MNLNCSQYCCRVGFALLLVILGPKAEARAEFSSTSPRGLIEVRMAEQRVVVSGKGQGEAVFDVARGLAGAGAAKCGIELSWTAAGIVTITSAAEAAEVSLEKFSIGRLQMAPQAKIEIQPDYTREIIFVRSLPGSAPVTVHFLDGGEVKLASGCRLQLDQFADRSYSVAAEGEVKARTADGKEMILSADVPPMTGGPLVRVRGAEGTTRFQRASPSLTAILRRQAGDGLQLDTGTRLIALEGEQEVRFENGAVLVLRRDDQVHSLSWRVVKGSFLFEIEEVPGWKVAGWTGQSAEMSWSADLQAVDVRNESTAGLLMVSLPYRLVAGINPGATFQFARVSGETFATSAAGGTVTLHNRLTGQRTLLETSPLILTRGATERPSGLTDAGFLWMGADAVQISLGDRQTTVRAGSEQILATTGGAELRVEVLTGGKLGFTALAGNFTLTPQAMPSVALLLPEGSEFFFRANPAAGMLRGNASSKNPSPVSLTTPQGASVSLDPGGEVLFVLPSTGVYGMASGAVYSEKLEMAGTETGGGETEPVDESFNWQFNRNPREIFRPRVAQPPVSTAGYDNN